MIRRHALPSLLCAFAVLPFLAACKVGPDYEKPETATQDSWNDPARVKPADEETLRHWWRSLGDARLSDLVDRALKANLDVAAASTRLRQARGQTGVAEAALIPSAGASGNYSRTHSPGNTDHLSGNSGAYKAGLDAAWELDFFGANRRAVEAAEASADAALEDTRAARASVAAEVALEYANWVTASAQARAVRSDLAAAEALLKVVRVRREVGSSSDLDVSNALAEVAAARAALPSYEIETTRAVNALAVLLATSPQDMRRELGEPPANLPASLTPAIPAGLPSDLLRRRPDIRAAERRLHAATANIGVAVADYFPKFSLTGSMGVSGTVVSANSPSPGLAWSVGPTASWNPFQGGAVSANVKVREALRDESTLTYRKTVLTALGEVENALIGNDRENLRRSALRETLVERRRTVAMTAKLFENGQTDLGVLLDARRRLNAAETSMAGADNAAFGRFVALCKALGGGWDENEAPAENPDAPAPKAKA